MTHTRTRSRGEKGVAIIMTALCLIPLMIFAAFGVDLASWYSRISYLQKSADAAALAGTVWMPEPRPGPPPSRGQPARRTASTAATAAPGPSRSPSSAARTVTSLRVTSPTQRHRYFSQVFSDGKQRLTRYAEAEYNLPHPAREPAELLRWRRAPRRRPGHHVRGRLAGRRDLLGPATGRRPGGRHARPSAATSGRSPRQGYGRWTNATTYRSGGFSGSPGASYSVRSRPPAGARPTCHRRTTGDRRAHERAVQRVATAARRTVVWAAGYRRLAATAPATPRGGGNRQCTWRHLPSRPTSPPRRPNGPNRRSYMPANRPCRVGYDGSLRLLGPARPAAGRPRARRTAAPSAPGNRLCRWSADDHLHDRHDPAQPDRPDPLPGLLGGDRGPADQRLPGRRLLHPLLPASTTCTSDQNVMYLQPTNADRGFWYVDQDPAGAVGQRGHQRLRRLHASRSQHRRRRR